jgi:hypothetical protein
MVRVFAIGLKVCGFKPSCGDGLLRVIKLCSTPSFRGAVRLEAQSCKILWHVKNPHKKLMTEQSTKEQYSSFLPVTKSTVA